MEKVDASLQKDKFCHRATLQATAVTLEILIDRTLGSRS